MGKAKLESCAAGGSWVSQGTILLSVRNFLFFFFSPLTFGDSFLSVPSLVGCSLRYPFLLRPHEGTFPYSLSFVDVPRPCFYCVSRFPIHQGK